MEKIIIALEENSHQKALKLLTENVSLLNKKSEDGWSVLQLASYYNSADVVSYCLKNTTKEQINGDKVHPLIIALEEKNKEVVNEFLNFEDSSKIDWYVKEKSGENLVHLAIHYGLEDIAEAFVKKGVSCFENNNQGLNAFTLIVEKGNAALFDKLDQHNNLLDNFSEVMIKKAIQFDHLDIFERLQPYTSLEAEELFNLSSGFNSVKIMANILESGEIIPGMEQITKIVDLMCQKYETKEDKHAAKSLADYLFEIKVPFHQFVNDKEQSAWMLCIQNNNEEIFERLMHSADYVNTTDTEQHSPLFYAIEKNNAKFVHMLLRKKANPNQLDRNKNTPLIKAVEKGNLEMVKEILKYCQMINEPNAQNEHALSIAIKRKRMDLVTELIWAGGEITTNPVKVVEEKQMFHFGTTGQSERFSYHEEEQIDNFIALSKLGFRLDQLNEDGDTFLLHFIKNGYISNFSALLRCQFNPNQNDNEGNSALMCSALKKQDEYFNAILNKFRNIDMEHKNNNGENVYDLCLKSGKVHRIEKLVTADDNLSLDNALKSSKMIAKDGRLEDFARKLIKSGVDLSFKDENNNNLLMFSLAGGNFNNFKYLIETVGVPLNIKEINKFGHSVENMIQAMPDDIKTDFLECLNKNKNRKHP